MDARLSGEVTDSCTPETRGGRWIRTIDLWVMSPACYQAAPSRAKTVREQVAEAFVGALPLSYIPDFSGTTGFEPATTRLIGEEILNYTPDSVALVV